jgi:RND family efflux transporter MFP subunit
MTALLPDSTLVRRLTALALLGAALAGCAADSPPAAPLPARVATAPVTAGPALPEVVTSGIVVTRDELRLSFKVAGIVRRIAVREGEPVHGGQTLATLELEEIDAEVEQARQLAAKAERDRVRGAELRAQGLISQGEQERLVTEAEVARARQRAAEFNRQYAVIVAPRDGVVLRRLVEEREFVAAGQEALLVGPRQGGYVVRAGLADRDVVKLALGDPARISVDAWPGVELHGAVAEIPGAASEETGLFEIEVNLEAADVKLVSGLLARVTIEPARGAGATLPYVPIGALVEADGERGAVFVATDGVARRREVTVAFLAPASVALSAGVTPGERVVTDGALYLEDGEPIEIVASR